MVIYKIFYDLSNTEIKFCSTDYWFDTDIKLHHLYFHEGNIGEINDCDSIITDDYSDIERFLKEIKVRYQDEVNQRNKVRLTLLIGKDLSQLTAERFEDLLDHFFKTARFATNYSGQGEFKNVILIKLNNDYYIEFEVIDKDLFYKVFLDLIGVWGLKEDDFTLN